MALILIGMAALSAIAMTSMLRAAFRDRPLAPPRSRLTDPAFRPPAEPDFSPDARARNWHSGHDHDRRCA